MKHYKLKIISKNEKSIKNFLIVLNNTFKQSNIIKKYFPNKKKKKVLTILKSPHINKTAQEQFEYRLLSNQINLYSPKSFQLLVFLKRVKSNLFPDIKIKVSLAISKKLLSNKTNKILDPNNFKLEFFYKLLNQKIYKKGRQMSKSPENSLKQIKQFLKILDTYGETSQNTFR